MGNLSSSQLSRAQLGQFTSILCGCCEEGANAPEDWKGEVLFLSCETGACKSLNSLFVSFLSLRSVCTVGCAVVCATFTQCSSVFVHVYSRFTQSLRNVCVAKANVCTVFTQYLCSDCAAITQSLHNVSAEFALYIHRNSEFALCLLMFAQCLRSVCAVFAYLFVKSLRSDCTELAQCLRSVCARTCMFTQCLRRYYVCACLHCVCTVFLKC